MQVRGCYFGKWGPSLLDQGRFFLLATPCSMRDLSSLSVCERAKSLQSCLTLCDPMDCSLPNSSVCGILQARILEWVACPPPGDSPRSNLSLFSLLHWRQVLHHQRHLGSPSSLAAAAAKSLQLCLRPHRRQPTRLLCPWAPLVSRQEHWSGLPFPSPMHESEK